VFCVCGCICVSDPLHARDNLPLTLKFGINFFCSTISKDKYLKVYKDETFIIRKFLCIVLLSLRVTIKISKIAFATPIIINSRYLARHIAPYDGILTTPLQAHARRLCCRPHVGLMLNGKQHAASSSVTMN
jgi:hypothetical protein